MKKLVLVSLLLVGCRNNPSTSAFPSIGQMTWQVITSPFRHHDKEPAPELPPSPETSTNNIYK